MNNYTQTPPAQSAREVRSSKFHLLPLRDCEGPSLFLVKMNCLSLDSDMMGGQAVCEVHAIQDVDAGVWILVGYD